ncbi:type I restriction enzyme HsdR N-terminal domain-containing protein [Nostoc sp. CHAB 5824]|nr:type I restriction enzyme HsdR N-terminal domain-containing protein [Nostoc sp. CHAB 5824]
MLDVRGGLKNTKMSRQPLAVLEEVVSNSIDSFLIRQSRSTKKINFDLKIEVAVQKSGFLRDTLDLALTVTDNGYGFDEPAIQAFVTKDTTYKDDLGIAGIQQCKGSGRIQYFHIFNQIEITSLTSVEPNQTKVEMKFNEGGKTISRDDFSVEDVTNQKIQTQIVLTGLKPAARQRFAEIGDLREIFAISNIKNFLIATFLQRLIGLSGSLGDFKIAISVADTESTHSTEFTNNDLPSLTDQRYFEVKECDPNTGEEYNSTAKFSLTYYRVDAGQIDLAKNAISLCAKSTPVLDITSRYLRTKTQENNELDGAYHIAFVESSELDKRVNEQRDGFDDLPETIPSGDLFSDAKISFESIYDKLDDLIEKLIAPPDWNKDEVKKEATLSFGISENMLAETEVRIKYGDDGRSVAKRVLRKFQDKIVHDTSKIVDLTKEVEQLEPDSPEFREKISEISWAYTASLKSFDMANLSQLIVRRTAIVKALELACKRLLACQNISQDEKRKDERLIHHIFFPMQATTDDNIEHDIWLLSEEYQYYDYIVSDRPLSAIRTPDGLPYFESDIDKELQKILAARADENKRKRPDLALFTKEGAAVIVELKAPGVSMDDHVGDLSEYAYLLNAKSGGKLRKFYSYLIGDTLNPLRLTGNWTEFADGKGYFQTTDLKNPTTKALLGEMYTEILYYGDVIDRAKKRINVYQHKLGMV